MTSILEWKRFVLALGAMSVAVALSPQVSGGIIYSICTSGCTAGSGGYSNIQSNSTGLTFSSTVSLANVGISGGVYTDSSTQTTFKTDSSVNSAGSSGIVSGLNQTLGTWTITLPTGTKAFGMTLFDPGGYLIGLNINGTGVPMTMDVGTSGGSSAFFGFVSDTSISSITITSPNSFNGKIGISDFETGTGTGGGGGGGATPEISHFC